MLISLAPLLRERGFDLALASPPNCEFARRWRESGARHFDRPAPPYGGLRTKGGDGRPSPAALALEARRMAAGARQISRLARDFRILHSNSLWSHFEVALAGRLSRKATVLHVHDLVRPGLGRAVLGAAVTLGSATAAISTAVADGIPGVVAGRITVLPNGVDVDAFRPGEADPAVRAELAPGPGPVVGILGRIDLEKGVGTVIDAVAALNSRREGDLVRLAVVGDPMRDPDYLDLMKSKARRLADGAVRFVGQRTDVATVIRSLDVLVNASAAEPFGMTVLEAQSCGVPVVATASGGIADIVTDGVDGLLVPPGDAAALAVALERVLSDPALGRKLAQEGRRNAVQRFSLPAAADRMAALYATVVN